jgi:formate dehydrogenase subunit delta
VTPEDQESVTEEPRVVRLAHDIAANFAHLPEPQQAQAVAGHIRSFWDPRMRNQLKLIADADPEIVEPVIRHAASLLP